MLDKFEAAALEATAVYTIHFCKWQRIKEAMEKCLISLKRQH